MGLGLLGALGGAGGAMSGIAEQTMREQAEAKRMAGLESMRLSAEDRQFARADDRDMRKLAMEEKRIGQRRGLLGEVLGKLPEDASDFDRSRALLNAGLQDEAKGYSEIGKAGDQSEYRSKMLEMQHEKRLQAVENARLRLEGSATQKPLDIERKADLYVKEGLYPDRKSALSALSQSDKGSSSTSLQKDAQWMVDQGIVQDIPSAVDRLKSDPNESAVRSLTAQMLADPRNFKMKATDARTLALQVLEAEKGKAPSESPATQKVLRYVPGKGLVEQ